MGYLIIFWTDERAIRKTLQDNFKHLVDGASSGNSSNPATDFRNATDRQELFAPIGKSIYELAQRQQYDEKFSLPFGGQENVFNYATTLHSASGTLLMWTGNKLVNIDVDFLNYQSFKSIVALDKYSDNKCFSFSLDHDEKNLIVAKTKNWNNIAATQGEFSIYWIYEDYIRHHDKKNDTILGEQFLNLMLSNWNSSKAILNYGNALNKVCSVLNPQFAFFFCAGNCLRIMEDSNTEQLLDYLKIKKTKNEKTD